MVTSYWVVSSLLKNETAPHPEPKITTCLRLLPFFLATPCGCWLPGLVSLYTSQVSQLQKATVEKTVAPKKIVNQPYLDFVAGAAGGGGGGVDFGVGGGGGIVLAAAAA